MRAVGFHNHGDASVLQQLELPDPTPGPGQVVLRVKAVALNHLDVWVRRGWPGLNLPKPHVGCSDIAGVIHALGTGVTNVKVGDEVVLAPGLCCGTCRFCLSGQDSLCPRYGILGETVTGGASEYFCVNASHVLPKPRGMTFEQAASFPLTFLTAWRMLMVRAALQPGETILVTGASSGVSVAGIQMAALVGCNIIAATSSAEKAARAKELGAQHTVDSTGDLKKQLGAIVGRDGVDVVLDHVGGDTFKAALGTLRRGGRLVTCGATTTPVVEVDLRHIFLKQQAVIGSTMGSRADLLQIVKLFEAGRFRTVVDQVLPFSRVQDAHRALEERKHFGKVVMTP